MSFLDYDLSSLEIPLPTSDREKLREYLISLIDEASSEWLDKPAGIMGRRWKSDSSSSILSLLRLSLTLHRIAANLVPESAPKLVAKMRQLLYTKSEKQYDEMLVELTVTENFADIADTVELEPLITAKHSTAKLPRSPDLKVNMPDGDTYVETTVYYFGVLDKWGKEMSKLHGSIAEQIFELKGESELKIFLNLQFPLGFNFREIPQRKIKGLVNNVAGAVIAKTVGRIRFGFRRGEENYEGVINWAPLPDELVSRGDSNQNVGVRILGRDDFEDNSLVAKVQTVIGYRCYENKLDFSAVVATLKLTEEAQEDLILKSLGDNTLKRKLKQYSGSRPYLIVLKVAPEIIEVDYVLALINKRIWSNSIYSSISGICIYSPQEEVEPGKYIPTFLINSNPNAANPLPKSLQEIVHFTPANELEKKSP